jgi:hypothetical protein
MKNGKFHALGVTGKVCFVYEWLLYAVCVCEIHGKSSGLEADVRCMVKGYQTIGQCFPLNAVNRHCY